MKRISESTVGRLSVYLRILRESEGGGTRTISSEDLARRAGTSAAQVRKDLSLFGTFGKRGLGYHVPQLVGEIQEILGLGGEWRVALVGAGKIGAALFDYADFRRQGFYIRAVFDTDPEKVGQRWNGTEIRAESELERVLQEESIDIVIVAVPAAAAQGVVERVVSAGVRAILNFAPTRLDVPTGVTLKNVNMAVELEGLSYALASGRRNGGRGNGSGD